MRVLLVEDKAGLAEDLRSALPSNFYAVDVAVSGSAADELAFVNTYDLIVLDWHVSAPAGSELLQRWRHAGNPTPVLLLTGRHGVEERVSGLDNGADDCLTKPFSPARTKSYRAPS